MATATAKRRTPDPIITNRAGEKSYAAVLRPPGRAVAATACFVAAVGSILVGIVAAALSGGLVGLICGLGAAVAFFGLGACVQSQADCAYWNKISAELLRRAEEQRQTA